MPAMSCSVLPIFAEFGPAACLTSDCASTELFHAGAALARQRKGVGEGKNPDVRNRGVGKDRQDGQESGRVTSRVSCKACRMGAGMSTGETLRDQSEDDMCQATGSHANQSHPCHRSHAMHDTQGSGRRARDEENGTDLAAYG